MAKQHSSTSATKGPAFEIRFCDDNRVQVFDLSGRRDPTVKQLPLEYRESEVLEGKLRYSKLIGYSPPPPEDATAAQQYSSATIRPKVSRANQELVMQTSRYSRSCSIPHNINEYEDIVVADYDINSNNSSTATAAAAAAAAALSPPATTGASASSSHAAFAVYQRPQAPQTPLPSSAYTTESIRQPAAVKTVDHHSDPLQAPVLAPPTPAPKMAATAAPPRHSPSHHHQYQQSSSNMYSIAPSMTSDTMVIGEKHTADNEYLYSENERQKEKAGCCCVIS
ncbi:hypothetical protein BDB00DRAFT_870984 [Zychaea mexicana]|uniref:uncharacterized protein n=1 Tax=Zychaea mexicana TaxID=64656 RepID=UPI0022FF13C3|nr:uncharacterized protein BDB00DRAFT_870984 [Zychaea mexicana]KAI9494994.1 hypothetical protein BDB00DRAFT_870984 [Zychaea mexicana]